MNSSISKSNQQCHNAFIELIKFLRNGRPQVTVDDKDELLITEAFDKYRLWAANVGASHAEKSYQLSLDYRLREASWLKDQIIDLLDRLHQNITRVTEWLQGRVKMMNQRADDGERSPPSSLREDNVEEDMELTDSSDSSSEELDLRDARQELLKQLGQEDDRIVKNSRGSLTSHASVFSDSNKDVTYLCHSISLLISHLYEIQIRRPVPMDRLLKSDDKSVFYKEIEHFDRLHARSLFPDIAPDVADRLGRLNTQRRRILDYRKQHHERLQNNRTLSFVEDPQVQPERSIRRVDGPKTQSHVTVSGRNIPPQTKATTFHAPPPLETHLAPPPAPFAESVFSRPSTFAIKSIPLAIPPQPDSNGPGQSFTCPFCYLLQKRMSEDRWKRHVLQDLQPYVCTFDKCSDGELFFSSKDDWFAHESRYHRCTWFCNIEGHQRFDVISEFLGHLRSTHELHLDITQLQTMGEAFRKGSISETGLCNLCKPKKEAKQVHLRSHIARHLERLACFVLPRPELDNELETVETGSNLAVGVAPAELHQPYGSDELDEEDVDIVNNSGDDSEEFTDDEIMSSDRSIEESIVPVPDSAEENWASCTDKFIKAREGQSSPPPIQAQQHPLDPNEDSDTRSTRLQTAPSKQLRREDYTLGWVCTLSLEFIAARVMLDEEHLLPEDLVSDHNTYHLGTISGQNVVIAHAYTPGITELRWFMRQLGSTFMSVSNFLLVGIGGGVPQPGHDIRLGDVVVGIPTSNHSGVIRYDLGKTETDTTSLTLGQLDEPSTSLLSAVTRLREDPSFNASDMSLHMTDALQKHPELLKDFSYPDKVVDTLLEYECEHDPMDPSCHLCGRMKPVSRAVRTINKPEIHYGLIASGNQVIKNARIRDKIAKRHGVLCFKLDATGLLDYFPCLVIRGICDYSDENKNKEFQGYAALAAAAYAKELISRISAQETSGPSHVEVRNKATPHRQELMKALYFEEAEDGRLNVQGPHPETCHWLPDQQEYKDWLDPGKFTEHHGLLWIRGNPGSGKSTIMKYLVERAESQSSDTDIVISFFFSAREPDFMSTAQEMYRSLLFQLLSAAPDLQMLLDDVTLSTPFTAASLDSLADLFRKTVSRLGSRRLFCFMDALDECPEEQVRDMVLNFEEVGITASLDNASVLVCFSSRHYSHIMTPRGVQLTLGSMYQHIDDIRIYIRTCITNELKLSKDSLAISLEDEILRQSNGTFLWVVLFVPFLKRAMGRQQPTVQVVRQVLRQTPVTLYDLYERILRNGINNESELVCCFRWLFYACRPLQLQEFFFGLLAGQSDVDIEPWHPTETTIGGMNQYITDRSKGLAEVGKSKKGSIRFIHETVRGFLLHQFGSHELSAGTSHDRLRACCQRLFSSAIIESLDLQQFLSSANSSTAADFWQRADQMYPLFRYATQHILDHSEQAQKLHISQYTFLEGFPWKEWRLLYNALQEPGLEKLDDHGEPEEACVLLDLATLKHEHLVEMWLSRHPNSAIVLDKTIVKLLPELIYDRFMDLLSYSLEEEEEPAWDDELHVMRTKALFGLLRCSESWGMPDPAEDLVIVRQMLLWRGSRIQIDTSALLAIAARRKHLESTSLLLGMHGNLDAEFGFRLVLLAANFPTNKKDSSRQDSPGADYMVHEVSEAFNNILNRLCKHGVDINAKNGDGQTVLHVVLQNMSNFDDYALAAVRSLVEHGAKPELGERTTESDEQWYCMCRWISVLQAQ